jgi:hypothetical protein
MSLAAVRIEHSEFDRIHDHLVSYKPRYRTMHLRQARYRNNKRELRYLHAMHAPGGTVGEIEGMISGPGVFWHYKILKNRFRTQLNVLSERGTDKDLTRIHRFLNEVFERIELEQGDVDHPVIRLPGQFYLRRKVGGASATHPHCQLAVAKKVLDSRFVSILEPWDLELVCP